MILDIRQLFHDFRITPKGVIHIGAHEGQELPIYLAMGFNRILFVEANPNVFIRLQANVAAFPQVKAVQCAISERNGTEVLHVTNFDASSSILPLKRHLDIYPSIQEEAQVAVTCRTLDLLLHEIHEPADQYNFINIDIQGAEVRALSGAIATLKHIDAINSEVNFEELYAGGALIHDLDAFLASQSFHRVAASTPHHPSWGDAFYVKG